MRHVKYILTHENLSMDNHLYELTKKIHSTFHHHIGVYLDYTIFLWDINIKKEKRKKLFIVSQI